VGEELDWSEARAPAWHLPLPMLRDWLRQATYRVAGATAVEHEQQHGAERAIARDRLLSDRRPRRPRVHDRQELWAALTAAEKGVGDEATPGGAVKEADPLEALVAMESRGEGTTQGRAEVAALMAAATPKQRRKLNELLEALAAAHGVPKTAPELAKLVSMTPQNIRALKSRLAKRRAQLSGR
jgi:hypothetical protein